MRTSPKNSNIFEWKSQEELISYPEAMKWMENRVQDLQKGEVPSCAWFLEHPPLYTLGSRGKEGDIFSSAKFPIFKTGRGGQVTYHGPGQRVVYLMIDLKSHYEDIRRYVHEVEGWIIDVLQHFGVKGERREGRVGIWVQKKGRDSKIAALGVRVQKWVTSHGFALNINPDLKAYNDIIPCGLSQYGVTSLQDLGIEASMEEVDAILRQACPFAPCA
ncbi:MAG: lipoyl(octanoyl) transferase LipB [Alphaproteobacteria bacterium]|nr:lipoyl(octanoyl) transferase LipB [Alphaproteobacteria bacterium]